MADAAFKRLPLHIVSSILCLSGNVKTLGRAILSHSLFYTAFRDDPHYTLRCILLSQAYGLTKTLYYAIANYEASSVNYRNWDELDEFLTGWFGASAPDPISFTLQYLQTIKPSVAATLSKTHNLVDYFAKRFIDDVEPRERFLLQLRGHRPKHGFNHHAKHDLSDREIFRLHRAFYLYQIYCTIYFRSKKDLLSFGRDPDGRPNYRRNIGVLSLHNYFFQFHSPWENEQAACILDFLEVLLSRSFDEVAKRDTRWGHYEVDWIRTGSENKYKQAYLSLGLAFLHKLDNAKDYAARYTILTREAYEISPTPPKAGIMMAFAMESMEPRSEWWVVNDRDKIRDLTESNFQSMVPEKPGEISDQWGSDPSYTWKIFHLEHTVWRLVNAAENAAARRCGYVLWDIRRHAPTFDRFKARYSLLATMTFEKHEKRLAAISLMEKSWETRAIQYNQGYRGIFPSQLDDERPGHDI